MIIRKRIRALEAKSMSEPLILYFADGRTRQQCGRNDFLVTLLADTCRSDLSLGQTAALELIRKSAYMREGAAGTGSE